MHRLWLIALAAGLVVLTSVDTLRLRHLEAVTRLAGVDTAPPGAPRLIPPTGAPLHRGTGYLESDIGRRLLGPVSAAGAAILVAVVLARWSPLGAAVVGLGIACGGAFFRPLLPGQALTDMRKPWWEWHIPAADTRTLTPAESECLVERHLAYWLSARSGGTGVVLAPPTLSLAVSHYGRLGILGTWDDQKGLGTLLTIAGVPTLVGCEEFMRARGVRYIVVPTWDPFFQNFTRYLPSSYAGRRGALLPALLALPPPIWLRPLAYQSPVGGDFAHQAIQVYEVVPDQSPAVALARDVEYEIEMGRLDRAAAAARNLSRFPGDLGALAARGQLALAQEDAAAFSAALSDIAERLANHADRFLLWDRRVSLAIVLAQSDRHGEAKAETERCVADLTAVRIRELSAGSLAALLQVSKALEVEFPDAALKAQALALLPENLRP